MTFLNEAMLRRLTENSHKVLTRCLNVALRFLAITVLMDAMSGNMFAKIVLENY
jgi:hypothetical protein